MKILVAPLNWGLGHATRSSQLIDLFLQNGHQVLLGGNGYSAVWLKKKYPVLSFYPLANFSIRFAQRNSLLLPILSSVPHIIVSSIKDHSLLQSIIKKENIDVVISDNRYGLFHAKTRSILITHQLYIKIPSPFSFLSPIVHKVFSIIHARFNEIWVPDVEGRFDKMQIVNTFSGELSHQQKPHTLHIKYIGILSRFKPANHYLHKNIRHQLPLLSYFDTVVVLSGVEPQRTLFEHRIKTQYRNTTPSILIVQGKPNKPFLIEKENNITIVPFLQDDELASLLLKANVIISRIGYSSLMDFVRLGVLDKVRWSAIEGQTEQEYLLHYYKTPFAKRYEDANSDISLQNIALSTY